MRKIYYQMTDDGDEVFVCEISRQVSTPEFDALAVARHFWDNYRGHEYNWPLNFSLYHDLNSAENSINPYHEQKVEMCMKPQFYVEPD